MEVLKVFDAYSLRARLFPAIVAAAPAFAALALLISWKSFELSNAIATLAILVLLFAIADFARERGRAIERKLYAEHGGMPSVAMFRRGDRSIDNASKERYRTFLANKLGSVAPTDEDELANPSAADAFYDQCGVWLRENTRDPKKFSLLFTENVTYGFRRNLFGVKWLALALNLVVVSICTLLLWRTAWAIETGQGQRVTLVLIVASAHALYMLLAVRRSAVWDAARGYGRQLILSCEGLLAGPTTAKKAAVRKSTTKKSSSSDPTE